MNIQKTLSAVLSVSMLFTSVGAMPVGNAYAEDDDELSWYDDHYEEIMVGNMYYHAPDKVIYKVGEQFDVTGGTSSGSGGIVHRTKESSIAVGNWDNFGRAYTLDELDLSGFDNTKPGVYEIMPAVKKSTSYTDEVEYSGFSVMVIDGEKSDDNYVSMVGDFTIEPPYNLFLKVGESVEDHFFSGDLEADWHYEWHHDGKVDTLEGSGFSWCINEYSFDFSEVDNTKPGIYRITPIKEKQRANVDKDEINYGYCYIMVTDGEPTEADKKKLQDLNEGIETPPAESVKVTTANVSEVTNVTTITTDTSHNDVMINEENLKVVSVDNGKIKTDDGRTFEFHSWTTSINEVKAGDTISIKGGFHYLPERNIYSECSASLEITDSVVTVKCEHCGKEIPKTEAVYGPLGFPVCRECYENGVYIGTTANFNPQTTTTTTVTTSVTTTTAPVTTYPDFGTNRCIPLADVALITEPTKTVYKVGEKLDLTGIKVRTDGGFGDSIIGAESIELLTDYKKGDSPALFANDYHFDSSKPGTYTIVLSFYGREESPNASFEVTVVGDDTPDKEVTLSVDSNCDDKLDISDAVLIMQTIANPAKYKLSEQGRKNADIVGDNDGITNLDALNIQKKLLKLV